MKRLLVACEYSGRVREAFRKKGWDAWSCDLLDAEDSSPYHHKGARKCIENPIMHKYAKERLGDVRRQVVQPWQFGEPFFKATGFELHNLPDLVPTNILAKPAKGTAEHKKWSACHMASPGPDRWKERSRTYQGIAEAMANQWGDL